MKDGPQEIDILHWMGRTALELIGQGGLGTSFDPLVEDVKNPFAEAIKNLVYVQFRIPCIVSIDHSLQAIFFTARSLPTSHTLYNFYWYSSIPRMGDRPSPSEASTNDEIHCKRNSLASYWRLSRQEGSSPSRR